MKYALIVALLFAVGCNSSSPTAPSPIIVTPPVAVVPPVVTPPINPLLNDSRFDVAFYHLLTSRPLFRWNQPPRVYLRTVDDSGAAVNAGLIEQTAAALINTTGEWAGGAFGVAGLERGASSPSDAGWITVGWSRSGICGGTTITGLDAGLGISSALITMNHLRQECTCGPLVAKHELGHAMGYKHVSENGPELMAATFQGVCDKPLSGREGFHARVAYSMPAGSMEP